MAGIVKGIGSLIGIGGDSAPQLPQINLPAAPTYTDPAVLAAAAAEKTASANAKGRASTILTSGQGDTSQATTTKKPLLGVS